jgi:hypothetical protein
MVQLPASGNLPGLAAGVVMMTLATTAPAPAAGWQKIELGDVLHVQIPDGAVHKAGQGIDSLIGTLTGDGFKCDYDLGVYSNRLLEYADSTTDITISGRPARLVWSGPDFDGIHVSDIEKTLLGQRTLTITCNSADATARAVVRKILKSIEIDR